MKLFLNSSPVPLPEWFLEGSDCRLKRNSMLENFPDYIRNFQETKDIPSDISNKLQEIRFKKPVDRPKYSVNLLRYALLLRYTSTQAYKLLLEQFPLPALSLLKKLNKGGMEPIKVVKVLLDQGKIGEDVVLLLDEIYLKKDVQYQGGKLVGVDSEGNLFKGVMALMINSLKQSIPFVIKAIPEVKIEGLWLSEQIDGCIHTLHKTGFNIVAVISDNHSANVPAFNILIKKYPHTRKDISIINHSSIINNRIYLFFDSVHLIKNIRNNLFNSRRFIFPLLNFDEFYDSINLDACEITWKLLHDVYDKNEILQGNLRKAYKLTYKSLHPDDSKQSVSLALSIFDATTSAAIESYYPDRYDASGFLKLINFWWTISNSKQRYNTNFRTGDAAVGGDNKPLLWRAFAHWLERWLALQGQNSQKFTLTKQT